MNIIKTLELVRRLDALIRRKATGTPTQLAARLGTSEATVYRYINELKALNAPIAYCKERESYVYTCNEFSLL
jgi:predicted DNA-binding transcriptional regulator YafY